MKIFSGGANHLFAESVASLLDSPLGKLDISRFADGEIFVRIKENVRGEHVFLIQSACPPVNERYMELFLILDALKRASAQEISVVMPYYGYARQDRKSSPRAPISAKVTADMLSVAGAHRLLVVDLHAAQIQGFFNIPVDNLFGGLVLAQTWLQEHSPEDVAVVSPDLGGMERVQFFARKIKGSSLALIHKRREEPNKAKALHLVGEVKGKTALIVDDMIDTAGTLCSAAEKLIEFGAKEVMAMATHPLFSLDAVEKIQNSPLKEVRVTNTIPLSGKAIDCEKIKSVSVAPLIAEAIKRIYSKQSISALFD